MICKPYLKLNIGFQICSLEILGLNLRILVQLAGVALVAKETIYIQVEELQFEIGALIESIFPSALNLLVIDLEPSNFANVNLPKLELKKFSGQF